MSIGTFTLVRNEAQFIRGHLANVRDHLDRMVFFDGDSTDGTLQALRAAGGNIEVVENQCPTDLCESYTAMFNKCIGRLNTDWGMFLHPDMWVENPEQFKVCGGFNGIAQSVRMISYAGRPGGPLYKIRTGRSERWKNIYRLRNPDLGAHYHGWYGAANEDVYFSEITGSEHEHYGEVFDAYPYPVLDSGLAVHHFSDVRTYERRLGRMVTCLKNQGHGDAEAARLAAIHPRVTLKDGDGFKFEECEDPRYERTK